MKFLKKLDENILRYALMFFVFFIPLYPKFPFKVVNYTYIAIRIDDFLIAIIGLLFLIQLLRGKVSFKSLPLKKYFLLFWGIIFISFLSGLLLTKTIPYTYIGFLHAARRVEYMMLFFIGFASIRSVRDFKVLMLTLLSSLALVNIYGMGQRFFEFPAIQTMNPEFAKGRILFLTPEARLSSTFGGHYDLAAFLVFMFPILWALYFQSKRLVATANEKFYMLLGGVVPFLLAVYSITAASIKGPAIGVFQAAMMIPFNQMILLVILISLMVFLILYHAYPRVTILSLIVLSIVAMVLTASRSSSIAYLISTLAFLMYFKKFRYVLFVLIVSIGLSYKDNELIDRWLKTIQIKQIIVNEKTGEEVVVQKLQSDELPAGTAFLKSGKKTTNDKLTNEIRDDLINKATLSGVIDNDGSVTDDDYQVVSGIAADVSISTRFDASWPRAINAFKRNPLVGTGPSSITESSDGDFFRWLGETGALGFIGFIGVIGLVMKYIFDQRKKFSPEGQMLLYGVIAGTMGLFINATLIDVFEASKVAYMFWFTLGIYAGLVHLKKEALKGL